MSKRKGSRDMLQGPLKQAQSGRSENISLGQRLLAWIRLAVAIGAAYFLAARLSLFLQTQPDGVAVFWPAAGIASGILIAFGRDARWPVAVGVIVATIAANLTSDRNIWSSSAFALLNAGEALFVAWLIERYVGRDFTLGRLRHVAALLAAAIVGTAISGVGGAAAYKLFHSSDAPALVTWRHWFVSDAMGIITVAPLLIGLVALRRVKTPRLELFEGIAAVTAMALTTAFVIFVLPEIWWDIVVPVELLFPLLLWLSARCRPAFTSTAIFVTSLMIVLAVTFNIGHFAKADPTTEARIWGAQAGIVGITFCALFLTAVFAERRRHAAVVRAVVNTVVDAIVTIDDKGVVKDFNPAAARVFGYRPEEVIGRNVKMLMPEPYRGEHDGYLGAYLRSGQARMIGRGREVTGQRKDGSLFPMELAISEMAVSGQRMFTGVVRDITERKQIEQHQELLVAELDHRVKNILAQVAVVAVSTRQGSRSMDEFLRSLNGRIQSMAAAHTLLSKSGWQSVGLDALVRNQLAPYATDTNVTISGIDVMLPAAEIQAVARVLHELATNAAKYGALSIPGGQVSVNWDRKSNGDGTNLMLVWEELGGPPVKSEVHASYGTNLIRHLIPHELGGMVDLAFASQGVRCKIEIPTRINL
jgi:PAS domain S-box-containing protein